MECKNVRKTAILVDGGYYRKRARELWGKKSAQEFANELYDYCMLHITQPDEPRDLYRIFYYDCPPMVRTMKHPLTGVEQDFANMPGTKWTETFYRYLSEKRKIALRMGELSESTAKYVLKDSVLDALISGKKTIQDLTINDFRIDVKQKGVDMRIGLDMASLAYGKHVNQIILIAGDSDFLPVIKMARRNGIDFLIDPMKQYLKKNMIENVDGIESFTDK